jgi:DNA-binding transcriptional regulator YhcF (GntR family)
MLNLNYDPASRSYKFEQIRDELLRNIENGHFKKDGRLPSITEVCEQYGLSRVTVERAYNHLKNRGYASYVIGKGFYVTEEKQKKLKILLVFNKLSYYKKMIYYGIIDNMKGVAKVDLFIHHYDVKILDEIITENLGKYNYYVIMPHFHYETNKEEYLKVIRKIPASELLLIDREITDLKERPRSVYQDFENDIYSALDSVADLSEKYNHFKLVLPSYSGHPLEIINGAKRFCDQRNKEYSTIENTEEEVLMPGTAYVAVEETELAELIKMIRNSSFVLGKDIGIISFNETILKELLDITVFSTDFAGMGARISNMIMENKRENIHNPFHVIRRKSF